MPAWSGLYNHEANSPAGHSLLVNKNPRRNGIKRLMNREGFRAVTELFDSLIGAAAGDAASASHKRVGHFSLGAGSEGGLRTVDIVTDINRNTTASDVAALKEMTFGVKTAPTYPARNQVINPR